MLKNAADFLRNYLKNLRLFSDNEITSIISLAEPKKIKKNQYILYQGNVCEFYTFVCTGCFRSFRIDENGREHIFSFIQANHWVSDQVSLITGIPSVELIDAIEDSIIIQLSRDVFKTLLEDIPNLSVLNTNILMEEYCRSRERIFMMTNHQAKEKYENFIYHFPKLHHRIPIYMIASYIGVARETLTRIRGNATNR